MRKKYICILAAVLSFCSLSGCGPSAKKTEEEKVTIGVVTKSKSSEYWLSVCDGMEDAAEKYHADVVILSPDSETEEKVQKNMIRDLLKTDIQALAVSPIDSYECEEYVQQAKEKGISVYACDTPIEDADVPYIGIDNEKLGYELGEQLARALDHKGKIGVIAGDFNQAGHRMRVNGFEKYMEKEPGITIEMVRNGYSNMQVSQKDVDEILKKYPDLDGIMTTSCDGPGTCGGNGREGNLHCFRRCSGRCSESSSGWTYRGPGCPVRLSDWLRNHPVYCERSGRKENRRG